MATWPIDLGYGTLTGRVLYMTADGPDEDRDPDLTAAAGKVTVTPSVKQVRYTGTDGPILLASRTHDGILDSEGYICTVNADGSAGARGIVLPATDSPNLSPVDFTYAVDVRIGSEAFAKFSITVADGETVDVAAVTPVATSGGTAIVVDTSTADRAEAAALDAEATVADIGDAIRAELASGDYAGEPGNPGHTPVIDWEGTALTVDGVAGPDLKGETGADSTVPGPPLPETGWIGCTMINGWTAATWRPGVAVKRIGNTVHMRVESLNGAASTSNRVASIPAGFYDAEAIDFLAYLNLSIGGASIVSGELRVWPELASTTSRPVPQYISWPVFTAAFPA